MIPADAGGNSRTLLHERVILCIGGLDPSGAAGLAADLQVVYALGGHAAVLTTLQTVQGRSHWGRAEPVNLALLREQFAALKRDLPIAGVKIGAVASTAQAEWLVTALQDLAVPAVLDPVLASSSGGHLSPPAALRHLAAAVQLCTPNRQEAEILFGLSPDETAWPADCPTALLVTDGAGSGRNLLLTDSDLCSFDWPRRPGTYRGSGCRLATAICCHLAAGATLEAACTAAQHLVADWIAAAWQHADGRHLPRPPA